MYSIFCDGGGGQIKEQHEWVTLELKVLILGIILLLGSLMDNHVKDSFQYICTLP